jgi:hypothetical protein
MILVKIKVKGKTVEVYVPKKKLAKVFFEN